uniref:Uncharacterized protein n=1 Tax=Arundo donax TaxID=35708 RepID=A0A0A9B9U2_ARUDO
MATGVWWRKRDEDVELRTTVSFKILCTSFGTAP